MVKWIARKSSPAGDRKKIRLEERRPSVGKRGTRGSHGRCGQDSVRHGSRPAAIVGSQFNQRGVLPPSSLFAALLSRVEEDTIAASSGLSAVRSRLHHGYRNQQIRRFRQIVEGIPAEKRRGRKAVSACLERRHTLSTALRSLLFSGIISSELPYTLCHTSIEGRMHKSGVLRFYTLLYNTQCNPHA